LSILSELANINPIRIELPEIFAMGTVNCYLFKDPEPTLIDCGLNSDDSWNALQKALQKESLQIKDIARIIITHAHVDHMGMARRIVEESGAKVWLSEYACDWGTNVKEEWSKREVLLTSLMNSLILPEGQIANYMTSVKSFFDMMGNFWQELPEDTIVKFNSTEGVDFGNGHWEAIYVPGHSSTQTCFYNKESAQMLSADMLLKLAPTPVIEYDPLNKNNRMKGLPLLLKSFQKLEKLDISTTYPGHYKPFQDHKPIINNQVNRIYNRIDKCNNLIKNGIERFDDIFAEIYPERMILPAISMLIGYLDMLEDNGMIRKDMDGGRVRFTAT